jgi:hypothetical protein
MRRLAQIRVRSDSRTLQDLVSKISAGVDDLRFNIDYGILTVNTYEEREGYSILMDDITKQNLDFSFAEFREYSKKEMNEAKLFHTNVVFPWEHDPEKSAEYYGTKYSVPNRMECECTKIQICDLYLDTKKIGRNHFVQIIPEFIISEFTKTVLEENQCTGFELKPVADFKRRNLGTYYQLIVNNILPAMSDKVKVEPYNNQQFKCNCIYKGYPKSELIYYKDSLLDAKDFNLTYEYLNAYRVRQLIVSSKVRDIFAKNKIKVNRFEPLKII